MLVDLLPLATSLLPRVMSVDVQRCMPRPTDRSAHPVHRKDSLTVRSPILQYVGSLIRKECLPLRIIRTVTAETAS